MGFYTSVCQFGKDILYRGIDGDRRIYRKIPYQPSLFLPSTSPTKYKTIDGKFAQKIQFESIKESKEFIEKYKDIENFTYYGNTKYNYVYIADNFPDQIEYDSSKIRIFNIDIETSSSFGFPDINNPVEALTAITVQIKDKFYVFSYKEFKPNSPNIIYSRYETEIELLEGFLKFWSKDYPDIVTGWNITGFDIPYLHTRITRILGKEQADKLSPYKWCVEKRKFFKGQERKSIGLLGISILDYMELYIKFQPKQERTSLNYISYIELGEKKLDYEEHGTLDALYSNDFQKFIEYNIKDVELVSKLEDKLKLLDLSIVLAYDSKSNFEDVLSQTRMWDNIIFSYVKKKDIVVPKIKIEDKSAGYPGAWVKDISPGAYDWIMSFDVASLYPNLMIGFNISPETLIKNEHHNFSIDDVVQKKLDSKNIHKNIKSLTASGHTFSNDKRGLIPDILIEMYEDRKKFKKLMLQSEKDLEKLKTLELTPDVKLKIKSKENDIKKYSNFQQTKKVCLNSCYGAFGNEYFRYFDVRLATAITLTGQAVIQTLIESINQFVNGVCKTSDIDYCVCADTDSCYITFDKIVRENFKDPKQCKSQVIDFLDQYANQNIQPIIEKTAIGIKEYLNAFEQRIQMKRECIADRGIWTAKKKYILNVYDSEGVRYAVPKVKISGIEAIKSSTPEVCRKKLKEAIKIILEGTQEDLWKLVKDFRVEYNSLPVIDIASPRKIGNFDKYRGNIKGVFKKGASFHIRGALWYNNLVIKNNLVKKYRLIENGDEIKFFYLKMPNNVIDDYVFSITNAGLPKELGLEKYIDYDSQFDITFISPLKLIVDKIGWTVEKINTLDHLFS